MSVTAHPTVFSIFVTHTTLGCSTGDKAVEYYIGAGMDANKLLLGVPSCELAWEPNVCDQC